MTGRYEIRVPYALTDVLVEAFPEMDAVEIQPACTMLIGTLQDTTELRSILARLEDLGMEFVEVREQPGQIPPAG
jgi:hypothetical protein